MKTKDFDFNIDSRVMPSDPVELRGKSRDSGRMIVLNRSAATIEHTVFSAICDFFRPDDLLVLNDSYTLANTLRFQHGDEFTQVDLCGHEPDGTTIIDVFGLPSAKPWLTLTSTNDDRLTCTLPEPQPHQLWKARFEPFELLMPTLDQYGQRVDDTVNLNPTHWKTAPQAYRSVYAKAPGSLDIPSAGLHFSSELLARAVDKEVEIAHITLHVGATEILAAEGRRVVAVGTIVMRTLETLAAKQDLKAAVQAQAGWTDLYIYPGFNFRVVDVLLTNLHQPRSSHIVLTAAFAGKDFVMRSYAEITEKGGYEFDMFGDSMMIV